MLCDEELVAALQIVCACLLKSLLCYMIPNKAAVLCLCTLHQESQDPRTASCRVVASEVIHLVNGSYTQPAWDIWRETSSYDHTCDANLPSCALMISPVAVWVKHNPVTCTESLRTRS